MLECWVQKQRQTETMWRSVPQSPAKPTFMITSSSAVTWMFFPDQNDDHHDVFSWSSLIKMITSGFGRSSKLSRPLLAWTCRAFIFDLPSVWTEMKFSAQCSSQCFVWQIETLLFAAGTLLTLKLSIGFGYRLGDLLYSPTLSCKLASSTRSCFCHPTTSTTTIESPLTGSCPS